MTYNDKDSGADSIAQHNKRIALLMRFKRQSIIVRVMILITILLFAVIVVLNFLTLAMGRWYDIGYYSIWILFAWIFIGVFIYIISKLISVSVHKHHVDKERLEQQFIKENGTEKRGKS